MSHTLHYDWVNGENGELSLDAIDGLGPTLALTRATVASVTDYNNIIKQVVSGEERYMGARRVENIAVQSQTFDNVAWAKSDVTVTADQIAAPDGTTTADLVTITSQAGAQVPFLTDSITLANVGSWTFSCYVKFGVSTQITSLGIFTPSFTVGPIVLIDSTGAVVNTPVGEDAFGVIDEGDGWFRVWLNFTEAADLLGSIRVGASTNDAAFTITDPDGTDTFYVWGYQVEDVSGQDDPAPSEYQATTTVPVARWYATKRRTNLIRSTEDFDNSVWTKSTQGAGVTPVLVTANFSTTSGGVTLDRWTFEAGDTGGGDRSRIHHSTTVGVTAGLFTASIWMATVTGTVDINFLAGAGAANENRTLTTTPQRFEITATASDAPAGTSFQIWATGTVTGAAAVDILIGGAQYERQTAVATAYIANTSTDTGAGGVASSSFDTTITPTGLLVEEARENIALHSEDMGNAGGFTVGTDAQVDNDTAIAPDGTLTADTIEDDGVGTTRNYLGVNDTFVSIGADVVHAFSVHAKADQLSWLLLRTSGFDNDADSWFDLSAGVVGTKDANHVTSGIEDAGNGWFRCFITFDPGTDDTGICSIIVADADADINVDVDGTSSIFAWGAQLEAGAFPTAYIATVATSEVRDAEAFSGSDVSWLNTSAGTMYLHFENKPPIGEAQIWFDMLPSSDRWLIDSGVGADDIRANHNIPTTQLTTVRASILAVDTEFMMSTTYAEDDARIYVDGSAGTPDVSGALAGFGPIGFTVGQDFQDNGSNTKQVIFKEIRYYNTTFADTELEALSNGEFPPEGVGGIRSSGDMAFWQQMMQLKEDDKDAVVLMKKYLDT